MPQQQLGRQHQLLRPQLVSSSPSPSPPLLTRSRSTSVDSPSASITLERTAETLDGIARQLAQMHDERLAESDPDLGFRCCCGAASDCPTLAARARVDEKLKLCGEIGNALLHRYEALEKKYHRAEQQLELKRKALADSLRHVANLERANTTHLTKFADLSRAHDALEKRFNQAVHSQNLTQQSLTHVRSELAKMRSAKNAQTAAIMSGASLQDRLEDAERRYEDSKSLQQADARRLRDELKWRKLAEERIADLETKLTVAGREVEEAKAARARDAQDLLANAKERLETLHSELSETFEAESPSEMPEYQRTLEDLVATNALLKHDAAELSRTLSSTMDENRALKEELEERIPRPRSRPLSMELRPLLARGGHARTGSNPTVGTTPDTARYAHARVASAAMPRTGAWEHRRQSSLAPSFTSTSTTEGVSVTSPVQGGLGFGPIGEVVSDGSPLARVDSNGRPISPDIRLSPRTLRGSFSSSIPYTYNGVPKSKSGRPRPSRQHSDRRSLTMRALGVGESIKEGADQEEGNSFDTSTTTSGDEATSPGDSASEASRKRASVLLPSNMMSPRSLQDDNLELPGPMAELPSRYPDHKRVGRRTLLLLSRSTGVQTDASPEFDARRDTAVGTDTPATPAADKSETGSVHEVTVVVPRGKDGSLAELIDHLTKILLRLRGVDVPTLNRRLKKQNLPGDVGHVSRSTISALQTEVTDLRHRFRNLLDLNSVNRREVTLLFKLLKDVFTDLLELQSVVNDVTINPKLAKQLQREAFRDEEAEASPQTSRLGWMAAPLTNLLFAAPAPVKAVEAPAPPASPTRPNRLTAPAPVRAAPKQQASTSATTTHVSVEFGGAGIVRRAAPATPKKSRVAVTNNGDVFSASGATTSVATAAPTTPGGHPRSVSQPPGGSPRKPGAHGVRASVPNAHGTLRPQRSRASRSDLLGIFAGAQPGATSPIPPTRVRHASSQIFAGAGGRTVRAVNDPKSRTGLSTIVDAVLDPTKDGSEPGADPNDFRPALLERTLRPRGLSDSSIRSTAVLDAAMADAATQAPIQPLRSRPVPARALANAASSGEGSAGTSLIGASMLGASMFGSLSRRLYPFRSPAPEATTPAAKGSGLSHPADDEEVLEDDDDDDEDAGLGWRDQPRSAALPISPGTATTATLAVTTTSTGVSPVPGAGDLLGYLSSKNKDVEISSRYRQTDDDDTGGMIGRQFTPGSLPMSHGGLR
ncbi:hypothetical protein Q8F55_002035 [Vanrija albida]|uniref:Cep57 centrosome microtubule-binding domain-containing protein n=1 Tax=Vanrija albida TaxID=181172 RepID=A0ABR3Q8N1_9TREE